MSAVTSSALVKNHAFLPNTDWLKEFSCANKNSEKYLFYTDEVLKGDNLDYNTINNFDLKLNMVNNYCPNCTEKALDFRITMFVD